MRTYKKHFCLLIVLLCTVETIAIGYSAPYQNADPIANFAWDENDTSRYEGHYRFENAYLQYINFINNKPLGQIKHALL